MFDSSKLPAEPGEYLEAKRKVEKVQGPETSASFEGTETEPDINYVERANVIVDNVSKRYIISQGRSSDASMTRLGRGKTVVDAIVGASLIALSLIHI